MLKTLKIKVNTERIRSQIYNVVRIKTTDENYIFCTQDSYEWFNNFIVKNNKDYTIISYNFNFWELDYCKLMKVEVIYVYNGIVSLKELHLRKQPDNFKVKEFVEGE